MAGRLNPRRAVAAAAAVVVLSTVVTLAVATAPADATGPASELPQERASADAGWAAQAQVTEDGWVPCAAGGRIERVEVLLALDRSGSLRDVDLDGSQRRRALHDTRDELAQLASWMSQLLSGSGLDFEIDVAMVAFHTEGEILADFGAAAEDYPPDAAIDSALVTGGDTDYRPAFEQALDRFEGSRHADSEGTCRLMVLFTDGIMDPFNTAGRSNPASERRAEDAVSGLLTDLCSTVGGVVSYRERMQNLGVSTYVAVLRGPNFDRGSGVSHLDILARSSKQAILAVTGHVDSPLLGGVDAADDCKTWSEVRAGEVIEIEDIGELADKLAKFVGELSLAVRRPHVDCQPASLAEVTFAGDWPHRLAVGIPAAESLCTLTPPLDGKVTLTVVGDGLPASVTWQIDDGGEPATRRTLMAGEANLPFGIVSSLLPEEAAVGAVAGARVEIAATWSPELQADWPEQPPNVPLPVTTLQLDVPDREAYWLDEKKLVVCRSSQRARWVEATGGFRAKADGLCTVKARPDGEPPGDFEFEMVPDPSDSDPLRWSASRSGDGDDLQEVPRGLPIVILPDGESVVLGALSRIFAPADDRSKGFDDTVRFALVWYSPLGEELAKRPEVVKVRVPPDVPDPIECEPEAEAQVTAALESPTGEWAILVDTGCRLLSPPQGTNEVTVTGVVRGRAWQLTEPPEPPSGEEQIWPTRERFDQRPDEPDRRLFVGVGHTDLDALVGEDYQFTLVSTRYDDAGRVLREQPELRSVTVYLPIADCATHVVNAVRFTPPASEGEEPPQRARAEGLCEIDPPPNGSLEVRFLPEDASDFAASAFDWRPKSGGQNNLEADPRGFLTLGPEDEPLVVGAISDSLPSDRVDPIRSDVRVELEWRSESGHVSKSDALLKMIIESPTTWDGVECKGTPSILGQTSEVPEAPLVVDTGCVLLAHDAGTVSLAEVKGFVAGLRWQSPDLSRAPGEPDRPIRIESDGVLPNEPLNRRETFELVSTLTYDGDQQLFDRDQVEVLLQFQQRIRLSCTDAPQIVGSPVEVPEGPLVVSTGCVLEAPASLGEVTVTVSDGDLDGVPWMVRGDVRLGPGDEELPILIETAEPLPNRRYDVSAEFALAAIWRPPDGDPQSVGEQPREVAVELRARPNAGQAVLIAVALLIGGLLAGWLLLAGVGWRTNRLPRSGAYRLVDGKATATVTSGGSVRLERFDLTQVLGSESKPLNRRRGWLRADDLTIRVRRQWWNPRDLLDGGRAAVAPRDMKNPLVAAAPSAAKPDSLSPKLALGAVIVALESTPSISRQDANRHRARVWILMPRDGKQASDARQNAARNLRTALDHLGRRLAPKSAKGKGKG